MNKYYTTQAKQRDEHSIQHVIQLKRLSAHELPNARLRGLILRGVIL